MKDTMQTTIAEIVLFMFGKPYSPLAFHSEKASLNAI